MPAKGSWASFTSRTYAAHWTDAVRATAETRGVEVTGLVIGALGLALAVVALLGGVAERPRMEVRPAPWAGTGQFPWDFLVVRVFNRPMPRWIGWLFSRHSAEGCHASLTFSAARHDVATIDQIPARWSAAPEPISWLESGPRPDPSKVPNSYRLDVPVGEPGEEVAIARTYRGEAFAFSAESYLHHDWRHPGWELAPGRWEVHVRVKSADAEGSARLPFDVSAEGALSWAPSTTGY
jgi:hypothetical protein